MSGSKNQSNKNVIDLSIIIPVYNGALLIDRCLDSIYTQITIYNFEVIIVDDGSNDNTIDLIKKRNASNLTIIQQANAGPATARNRGIEIANAKYCTFIDADDYWVDGYIQKSIEFLEMHPECIAVNVAQKHFSLGNPAQILPACVHDKLFKIPIVLDNFYEFWALHNHVCTGSVLMKTEIVKLTGGQREDLRITEDLEFWAFIATFGMWGFIPEILFVSDGSDVTREIGWLEKMKKRWNNAPTVKDWEKRIVNALPTPLPKSYLMSRGTVARNLVYCQLLSNRIALSRSEALEYGDYFPKDIISNLMNIAKHMPFSWWLLSKFLLFRELQRK